MPACARRASGGRGGIEVFAYTPVASRAFRRGVGATRAMRARFIVVALLSGSTSLPLPAADLETVLVTGSRIGRPGFESASPILGVSSQVLRDTGAATVEGVLADLPQFVPASGAASNDPGLDGAATLSLRGFGAARTLVLLDGRRLVPADGGGAIDVNVLPPALLDGVEVVSGGASAVYGSDAVAGVVNFRLRDDFEGLEFDGQWSRTTHGDAMQYSAGLSAGHRLADGRLALLGHVAYAERDPLLQSEREVSRVPLGYFPGPLGPDLQPMPGVLLPAGNGIAREGTIVVFADPAVFTRLFERYGYLAGTVPYQAGFSINPDGSLLTIGDGSAGSVANFRGDPNRVPDNGGRAHTYDETPDTLLLSPLERLSAFGRATLQLGDAHSAFLQLLFADYDSRRQLGPVNAGIVLIPPTNPYLPPDLRELLAARAAPAVPFRDFRKLIELGPRVARNDRELQQWTAGLDGSLVADWEYSAYLQYGRNDRDEHQSGIVRISRIQDLTFAADGGESICGGYDPLQPGTLSPACADYIATTAENSIRVTQSIAELTLRGPALSLPAGALDLVVGAFHKRDEFDYRADPVLSAELPAVPGVIGPRPDIAGFGSAPDRAGEQHNTDFYVEALVPLLAGDSQRAGTLDLGLGYRYADYSLAGGADAWKAELRYRPLRALGLRSSYQRAVRAPSIEELFYPEVANQFVVPRPDPCSVNSAARNGPDFAEVEALCVAQGLPPALLPTYRFDLRRVDGVEGGNPELDPERANTLTLGLVFESPFEATALRGLRVALDWYRIELDDAIGRWDSESAVERCYDPQYNPEYALENVYCQFFTRRPPTGEMYAQILNRNLGSLETSGLDLQLDWRIEAGPGTVQLDAQVGYVDSWFAHDPGGKGGIEYVGTIGGGGLGGAVPRWKGLFGVGYEWQDSRAFLRWQHIDAVRDGLERWYAIPARDYVDLGLGHDFSSGYLAGLNLQVGIENVFDEQAPVYPSYEQANTHPSQYDVLGRRWYLGLGYRF